MIFISKKTQSMNFSLSKKRGPRHLRKGIWMFIYTSIFAPFSITE